MKPFDLSCDLGEASTREEQAVEDALWPLIGAGNVACGGHAGDEETMTHAVLQAKQFGVVLGAHPSYPDREHFGRRSMEIAPEDLKVALTLQLRTLQEIALAEGLRLGRVKPHGALYNDLHANQGMAHAVVEAIRDVGEGIAVVATASSAFAEAARSFGLPVIPEAFADRRYRGDGSLVPRGEEGSLLLDVDEAADQAVRLARDGKAMAADGREIEVPFSTLCIHGDMPDAVPRVRRILTRLEEEGLGPSRMRN